MLMQKQVDHKAAIELQLCREDYNVLAQYHSGLLDVIEAAINDGKDQGFVRRVVQGKTSDRKIVERCDNAAVWLISLEGN